MRLLLLLLLRTCCSIGADTLFSTGQMTAAGAAAASSIRGTPAQLTMLAQLQSSLHPSKLLLVLGLHAQQHCTW